MRNYSDAVYRSILKNWVAQRQPPANGRARLLWEAGRPSGNKIDFSILFFCPQHKSYPSSNSNDWKQTLFTWVTENSILFGIQARIS